MYVPGHLATAALLALAVERMGRRRGGAASRSAGGLGGTGVPAGGGAARWWPVWVVVPAMLGALTPDLLDKSLLEMGVYRWGRTLGHSVFVLGGLVGLWLVGRRAFGHRLPRFFTAIGFWVLGIASHIPADLADDALRAVLRGGQVIASWMLWPWLHPYSYVLSHRRGPIWPAAGGVWPWRVTPLEVAVVALAVVIGGVWVARQVRGARTDMT